MDFYFLGTGNAFGHGGRRRSHYLWMGKQNWLIDASYDALSGLRSIGKTVMDIDTIFISHLHPDHYMALPQFALENYYVIKKKDKIPLFLPEEGKKAVYEATELFFNEEIVGHLDDLYDFIEIGVNKSIDLRYGSLETLPAQHSGNGRMQIIEKEGIKLGYTGDTSMNEEYFTRLLESDFVISEASTGSHNIPDHITLAELMKMDNPNETPIYISHVGESTIAMKGMIKPPLFMTKDGMKISV